MDSKRGIPRRNFLQGIAAAAAIGHGARSLFSQEPTSTPSREKLSVFAYGDVKLTGGPLKAQWDRIHASYMKLDEDRLLKVYRQRAGLPAPGEDMGGWYDADGFGPGQVLGQIISGLARFYGTSGDAATQAKVQRLVNGFAATIDSDDYWYPSLKASTSCAAYTLDKILVGLLDAHNLAGVSSALDAARRCIKGSVRYLPPRAYEHFEAPKQEAIDEPYTLPENLFYAYETTGDQDYREMARKYLMDRTYFDPLSRGENVLPGLHAYSHVNALCSASRAYLVLGEPKYLLAVQNAWEMITKTQSFASGGWGPDEAFVVPNQGRMGESLTKTHAHFETPCGSYAHLKLTRYLLRFTGEGRYGDSLERVLYNTILGVKDPKGDGHVFYYSDYHPSTQKAYNPDKWPCCSGTTPQVVADYVISTYFRAADGIYVNLFTPSEVTWKVQETPVNSSSKRPIRNRIPPSCGWKLRLPVNSPFTCAFPAGCGHPHNSPSTENLSPSMRSLAPSRQFNAAGKLTTPFSSAFPSLSGRNPSMKSTRRPPL